MAVTLAVIVVLCLCLAGVYRANQRSRLRAALEPAERERTELLALLRERFEVAGELVARTGDADLAGAVASWDSTQEPDRQAAAYVALDAVLDGLERKLSPTEGFATVQPLFVRLSEIEDRLAPVAEAYNAQAMAVRRWPEEGGRFPPADFKTSLLGRP